jgi:hypothetical protein
LASRPPDTDTSAPQQPKPQLMSPQLSESNPGPIDFEKPLSTEK